MAPRKKVAIEVEGTIWSGEARVPARNLIPALHAYCDQFEVELVHSPETPRYELMAFLNDLEEPWRQMGAAAGISEELPRRYASARVTYAFVVERSLPFISHRAIYFHSQWPSATSLHSLLERAS